MEPKDLAHQICGGYITDRRGAVDHVIWGKVHGMNRARDFKGLSTCTCHFDWLNHTVDEWRFLRQIEAFFKKNASFVQPDVCEEAARRSFDENEQMCTSTNLRLKQYLSGTKQGLDLVTHAQVASMERYIRAVLGDLTPFINSLPELIKVTPGATAQSSRRNSLPQLKLKARLYCTTRARAYVHGLFRYYGFDFGRTKTTSTNRIELVPKNWKTHRTIACEPEGNLPLQLAFDTYVKRRLKKFGIDLSNQSANKRKAKHASIHNNYVTVDFSSASDTISYNTVAMLLPPQWFSFLDDVRSPEYRGVFGEGTYAKFSSMGNGCTFTLETLLFAAACHAVGARNFLVYGDDVIIAKKYYSAYKALTAFLGFSINEDKSFAEGPFRESCGGDYFNGIDVTPVYIRDMTDRKASLCHLVNTLGKLMFPGGKLEALLTDIIRDYKLPVVPYQESTMSGIWIDPSLARTLGVLRTRHGISYFKAYTPRCKWRRFPDSRGFYLWFILKKATLSYGGPWDGQSRTSVTQTSSVPLFDHAYVRKRVHWHIPVEAMPDHVLLWSDIIPALHKGRDYVA